MQTSAERPTAAFVPICCDDEAPPAPAAVPAHPPVSLGVIEINIGRARLRVQGSVDLEVLRQVLIVIGADR